MGAVAILLSGERHSKMTRDRDKSVMCSSEAIGQQVRPLALIFLAVRCFS